MFLSFQNTFFNKNVSKNEKMTRNGGGTPPCDVSEGDTPIWAGSTPDTPPETGVPKSGPEKCFWTVFLCFDQLFNDFMSKNIFLTKKMTF